MQIRFAGPEGMTIQWATGDRGPFNSELLVAPARHNLQQGQFYRLKLTQICGYEGVELHSILDVAAVLPHTAPYLEHNAIPVQVTPEDVDAFLSGQPRTKVIYLPDEENQRLGEARVEIVVNTELDTGVDPIAEADRRGSILAVVRQSEENFRPAAVNPLQPPLPGGPSLAELRVKQLETEVLRAQYGARKLLLIETDAPKALTLLSDARTLVENSEVDETTKARLLKRLGQTIDELQRSKDKLDGPDGQDGASEVLPTR